MIPDEEDGIWTMTDTEFKRELARAWDEGGRAATGTYDTGYPSTNPYRSGK